MGKTILRMDFNVFSDGATFPSSTLDFGGLRFRELSRQNRWRVTLVDAPDGVTHRGLQFDDDGVEVTSQILANYIGIIVGDFRNPVEVVGRDDGGSIIYTRTVDRINRFTEVRIRPSDDRPIRSVSLLGGGSEGILVKITMVWGD